jgi:uncharacterized protein YjaZ
MKVRTNISKLDTRTQKKIVRKTIMWCQTFFGENNRRKNELSIYVGPQPKRQLKAYGKFFGCYDCIENKLSIYLDNCDNIADIIKTTIHEYTHYTQPVRSRYYKYDEQYGYNNNPFEVVARKNETLYKNCWKSIKNLL